MVDVEHQIQHVVIVGSGKGGVGKSSIVVELALELRDRGHAVGVLDADITAPDIPLMLGVTRNQDADSIDIWRPAGQARATVPVELQGLRVMSLQFMISEQQALAIDGHLQRLLLSQLWTGVRWGSLDYLLVDLPPGTGTVQQSVIDVMPVDAALVVVTPQYVAHLDARKLVTFLNQRQVPIIGGIENMGEIACPHCDEPFPLFPRVGHERTIWSAGVDQLASIPFRPAAAGLSRDQAGRPAIDSGLDGVVAAISAALPIDGS